VNPINGHRNFSFTATFQNKEQLGDFQTVLNQNKFIPPSSRIDTAINGQPGWGLHVENVAFSLKDLTARFTSHLDIGDPNRDIVGIFKHVRHDFFAGHKKGADLDPKCN
jgi:hypothetical protein